MIIYFSFEKFIIIIINRKKFRLKISNITQSKYTKVILHKIYEVFHNEF